MENRFSFYEKCRNGSVYWAYFKVNLNGCDESGQCLLTENEKKYLIRNVLSVRITYFKIFILWQTKKQLFN